ncbi:GL23879 [Drosophila persimilis]|uniref:GL23879 n=1 Tax=Drosophila persimilis TaxID=7234 RepID=B4G6C0_DROPE|nr:GL23879 [Drosophila persimilis]
MSFNAAGDYQLVMQTYKYKKHNIICSTKVLPSQINHFGKKLCDYHWMTPARWTNVESGLWDLLEKEQDVQNVHADLLIDHIKVRVDSTEYRHSASQLLLPGVILSKSDLSLSVKLEYIPQEDTKNMRKAIDSSIKREVVASKARDQQIEPASETEKDKSITPVENLPAKKLSSRRSISQESERSKTSNRGGSSLEKKPIKRTQSSLSMNSSPSSVGPSPPGRPRRSLTRPSHLDDFIVGYGIESLLA